MPKRTHTWLRNNAGALFGVAAMLVVYVTYKVMTGQLTLQAAVDQHIHPATHAAHAAADPTEGVSRFLIEVADADITVRSWARPYARVSMPSDHQAAWHSDLPVHIETIELNEGVMVQVPQTCSVRLVGTNAGIALEGLRSDVFIAASNGGISLHDVTGTVYLEANGGDVTVAGDEGALHADITNGELRKNRSAKRRTQLQKSRNDKQQQRSCQHHVSAPVVPQPRVTVLSPPVQVDQDRRQDRNKQRAPAQRTFFAPPGSS